MRSLICNTLFAVFGHSICCGHIPDWTAGRRWDTVAVKPWNLYNIIWRVQVWIRAGVTRS
jgi:hypothetical protein